MENKDKGDKTNLELFEDMNAKRLVKKHNNNVLHQSGSAAGLEITYVRHLSDVDSEKDGGGGEQ